MADTHFSGAGSGAGPLGQLASKCAKEHLKWPNKPRLPTVSGAASLRPEAGEVLAGQRRSWPVYAFFLSSIHMMGEYV